MELKIVSESNEILRLHKAFVSQMKKYNDFSSNHLIRIATRGGHFEFNYCHNKKTDLWWTSEPGTKRHKLYNRFGLSPNENTVNRMVVQINYLKDHDSFREAGLWASDAKGDYYLLHSGKMGGGVEGITKENVDNLVNAKRVSLEIGKKPRIFYVICRLGDKKMFFQVMAFVKEIQRIKNIFFDKNGTVYKPKNQKKQSSRLKKYFPEFWGKRKYTLPKAVNGNCNHGYIVHSLMEELKGKGEMVKSMFVDLGIAKKGKPVALFEVKTNCDKQSIYTAIGQLVLHSSSTKVNPTKYFVIPDVIDPDLVTDLKGIGINTITYKWQNEKPVFTNLNLYF